MAAESGRTLNVPFVLACVGTVGIATTLYIHSEYEHLTLVEDLVLLVATVASLICEGLSFYLGGRNAKRRLRPSAPEVPRRSVVIPPATRAGALGGVLIAGIAWGIYPWADWLAALSALAFSAWYTRTMFRGGSLRLEQTPTTLFVMFGAGGIVTIVGFVIGVLVAVIAHVGRGA
jgi:hypothetical protein